MFNIYIILNRINGHKYLGFSDLPLNKVWREILENYKTGNSSLYNTMRKWGDKQFTIKIVEEVNKTKLESRMEYWMDKYNPEYNKDAIEYETIRRETNTSYKQGKRKWGYNRKHKPRGKPRSNVIKCRSLETGKLKTLHGWEACAKFCGGDISNIKKAIRRNGTAYGYKWWIYKKNELARKVYGVNKDGDVTKTFNSISEAMRHFNEEDRGKGICTSLKWKQRWKGYLWYYAD